MFQELIYTSAPRGLKTGSKGFCTVARTPNMAEPLAELLETLSSYRSLDNSSDPTGSLSPIVYSYLIATVLGHKYEILSRIAPAPRDFSGRDTNYIAHHVVIDTKDQCEAGPAWMIKRNGFFKKSWEGTPRELKGNPRGQKGTLIPTTFPNWEKTSQGKLWAGALADSFQRNQDACLIYPLGTTVLPLIVEAQSLLSTKERWQAPFSTFVTGLSNRVNCRWHCLLDGSPEALKARKNANHLLIDLCDPNPSEPPAGPLVTAVQTGTFTKPPPSIPPLEKAFDATDPTTSDVITFDRGRKRREGPAGDTYGQTKGPGKKPPTLEPDPIIIVEGGKEEGEPGGKGPVKTLILVLSLLFVILATVGVVIWQKDNLVALWNKQPGEAGNSANPPVEKPNTAGLPTSETGVEDDEQEAANNQNNTDKNEDSREADRNNKDLTTDPKADAKNQDSLQREAEALKAAHAKLTPTIVPHFSKKQSVLFSKEKTNVTGVTIKRPSKLTSKSRKPGEWVIQSGVTDIASLVWDADEAKLIFRWKKADEKSARALAHSTLTVTTAVTSKDYRIEYGKRAPPVKLQHFDWVPFEDGCIPLPEDKQPKRLATIIFSDPLKPTDNVQTHLELLILQRKQDRANQLLHITPLETKAKELPTWSITSQKDKKKVATVSLKPQSNKKRFDLRLKLDLDDPKETGALGRSVLKVETSDKQNPPDLVSFFPRPSQTKPYFYSSGRLRKLKDSPESKPVQIPFNPTNKRVIVRFVLTKPTRRDKKPINEPAGARVTVNNNKPRFLAKATLFDATTKFTEDPDGLFKLIPDDSVIALLTFEEPLNGEKRKLGIDIGYTKRKNPSETILTSSLGRKLYTSYERKESDIDKLNAYKNFNKALLKNRTNQAGVEMDVHLSFTETFHAAVGSSQVQVDLLKAGTPQP